jgi:hypothetical protein
MDTDTPTLDHANDSILASWNEIRGPESSEPEKKPEPATFDAETGKEVVADKPAAESGRVRGADGKFQKAIADATAAETALAGDPAAQPTAEELAAEAAKPAVESPKSLRKELADKHWSKLDPEIQSAWNERDQNYERGIQRYRERAETADRLESAFAPYRETLQHVNATPEQAISTLLGMDHILRHGQPQEKAALIAQLTRQFNVPLEEISQVGPLQQQLLAQRQQLHAFEAQQSQAQQQQAQRELDALTGEVVKFSEGKEHFDTVSNEMFALLPNIAKQFPNATPQEKLQKAYDIAVVANPSVRAALDAKRQAQAQAEARTKAVEAKKAAAVNRTPRGVVPAQAAVGSMEDTIRAQAKALGLA